MPDSIQLTISLRDSKPLIWRSILVNKDTSFFELHHILQIVMGWKNYHLFEFNLDGYRIGMIEENGFGYANGLLLDATKLLLTDILSLEKDRFQYNYDFGDCWQHEIMVEQVVAHQDNNIFPSCIYGQLNCPPEDCGGIGGYYDMLKILRDKTHPEHGEMRNWVGKKYDPESFNVGRVNRQLKQLRKYISRWNSPD